MKITFLKNNIPLLMRQTSNYVGVKLVPKPDGKTDKIPIDCKTFQCAKTNDPDTWCSFEMSVAAYEAGKVDTIGFVFTREIGIVGVDFDHCFSTGRVKPEIATLISGFDSYAEVSQSLEGFHVLGYAKIPRSIKTKQVEIYDSGRFFALTGNILQGFEQLNDIQAAVDSLIATLADQAQKVTGKARQPRNDPFQGDTAAIIEKIRGSRQGALFGDLWCGNVSGYPSRSEADSALCFLLAFWFGDAVTIDAVFRQSALYRPDKWNKRHHADGSTYGQTTINRALAVVRTRFESHRKGRRHAQSN